MELKSICILLSYLCHYVNAQDANIAQWFEQNKKK